MANEQNSRVGKSWRISAQRSKSELTSEQRTKDWKKNISILFLISKNIFAGIAAAESLYNLYTHFSHLN